MNKISFPLKTIDLNDKQIKILFSQIANICNNKLDGILHSIAFTNRNQLQENFIKNKSIYFKKFDQ